MPTPQVGAHDVLVRIHAAGVNPLDNMIVRGDVKAIVSYDFPLIMGNEFDFKGCRCCLGCKLARTVGNECVVRDGIADLLSSIRHSDGLVYAAPIYFYDIPGQLHAFLERLIYPGSVEGGLPVSAIYTMNDKREDFEQWTKPILDTLHLYFKWSCGALPAEEVYAFGTMQREVSDRYRPTHTDHAHKVARYAEIWDSELARAREAGTRFGQLLLERE